jgi:hypothetical protein
MDCAHLRVAMKFTGTRREEAVGARGHRRVARRNGLHVDCRDREFHTIDRLLTDSGGAAFTSMVQRLGQPQARDLLRYLSSELNRLYFQMWNVAQLALGVVTLWLIARSGRDERGGLKTARRAVLAMLAIVVLMLVYLTPAIVSLGRSLDFVPRDPAPAGMQRFWILHATYTSLEMIKLLVGAFVAVKLVRRT